MTVEVPNVFPFDNVPVTEGQEGLRERYRREHARRGAGDDRLGETSGPGPATCD